MEKRLDMLKYFKEGQTSTKKQWARDLGDKSLKIMGNSACKSIKASLEEGRRGKEKEEKRGKGKWGEKEK